MLVIFPKLPATFFPIMNLILAVELRWGAKITTELKATPKRLFLFFSSFGIL